MLVRYEIGLGIQFDKDGAAIPVSHANMIIRYLQREASDNFGGVTVSRVQGRWVNDKGQLVTEDAVTFVLFVENPNLLRQVEEFANDAGKWLNQDSVVLTWQKVKGGIRKVDYEN